MSLEAEIAGSPRWTRVIGWVSLLAGLAGFPVAWRALEAYPTEPPAMSLADAIRTVEAAPGGEAWVRILDLPADRSRTFALRGGATHLALATPHGAVFVEWNRSDVTPPAGPLAGEFKRLDGKFGDNLRARAPDVAPAGRPAWFLNTWAGPSNVRAGLWLAGAGIAIGLFLVWAAGHTERKARALLRGEAKPETVERWHVRVFGLVYGIPCAAILVYMDGPMAKFVGACGAALALVSLVAPGLLVDRMQQVEDEQMGRAMDEVSRRDA